MKSSVATIATLAVLAALAPSAADSATVVVAKDCTQSERQLVNKLLEQDVNPFKACATKAKSDITTISTSRLCPIAECKVWLAYMAESAPNCVYDDTNYGVSFKAKAKDCSSDGTGSVSSDADAGATTPKPTTKAPTTKSSTGSLADAGVTTPKPTTKAPLRAGSSSSSSSKSSDTTIEIPVAKDNSTVIEPGPTPKPTTKAPVTPAPSSATSLNVASALCAVSLVVAAFVF